MSSVTLAGDRVKLSINELNGKSKSESFELRPSISMS